MSVLARSPKRTLTLKEPIALIAVSAIAVALLVRLIMLGERFTGLQQEVTSLRANAAAAAVDMSRAERMIGHYEATIRRSTLEPGVELVGIDLDLNNVHLYLGRLAWPLILYSIDPSCTACASNLSFLNAIQEAAVCDATVIGIGIGPPADLSSYARGQRIGFSILSEAQGPIWSLFPLATTPTTVLLDRSGRVVGWWQGTLDDSSQLQILRSIQASCA